MAAAKYKSVSLEYRFHPLQEQPLWSPGLRPTAKERNQEGDATRMDGISQSRQVRRQTPGDQAASTLDNKSKAGIREKILPHSRQDVAAREIREAADLQRKQDRERQRPLAGSGSAQPRSKAREGK